MNRILSIDVFRGLMLVLMTINHLFLVAFISLSEYNRYVYGVFGYFTFAEGFFFLSGLVSGIIYSRYLLEGKEISSRIFRRIGQMYGLQLALFALVALALHFIDSYAANWRVLHETINWHGNEGIYFLYEHPLQALALGSCFLYLPPFFDILPMYIFFLVATPWILDQLNQGKMVKVFALSSAFWLLAQLFPDRLLEGFIKSYLPMTRLGWFDLTAWQLLFVTGLILGFLKTKGFLPKLPRYTGLIAGFAALIFFFLKHFGPDLKQFTHTYTLGPLRIINFGAVVCCAASLQRFFTLRLLALLGNHSLVVFLYHVGLSYVLVFFLEEISSLPTPFKFALLVLSVLSLWIPAWLTHRKKQQKKFATVTSHGS